MDKYTAPWNETTTVRAAQAYGRMGLRVLPVSMREKRATIHKDDCPAYQALAPLAPWQEPGKGSQHTAHCSPHAIAAMFVPYLPARIGYAPPPGVIIIDVDNGSLREKHPVLWAELEASDTFVVRTRRGFHFYFNGEGLNQTTAAGLSSLPDDHPLRCVDVKVGAKGITILPPSPPYTYLRGRPDRLAPLPAAMMAECSTRPAGRRGVLLRPSSFRSVDEVDVGGEKRPVGSPRHPRLLSEAGRLRARGYDEDAILVCLRDLNHRIFDDPKDDDKLIAMARDVCERYAAGEQEQEPKPAASKPEAARFAYTRAGLKAALKSLGIQVARMQPRDQGAARFRGDNDWLLTYRRETKSRIICELREGCVDEAGNPYYIKAHRLLDALLDEVVRMEQPVEVADDVDPDQAALEACILALKPGAYRIEDIVDGAGLRNRHETAARAASLPKYSRMARRLVKRLKWVPGDPTTIWTDFLIVNGAGTWSQASHPAKSRVWKTPHGWRTTSGPLLTLVGSVDDCSRTVAGSGQ